MQNAFLQVQPDAIIIDRAALTLYGGIAAGVLVVALVIYLARKARTKPFIKTIPTNLKGQGK